VEIESLIKAVFKNGENEWSEIQEELNQFGIFKSPNESAFKWKQIKYHMNNDIKRIRKTSLSEKIITKHEWMAGALSALEKVNGTEKSEESSEKLY
jgi:hypothetical protein